MNLILGIFIFLFGIIFGSFLNVCIQRMPREESIVKPASHCPNCKAPIAWRDNIPLFSFLALGGKCRICKEKISVRYFWVELFSGLLWLGLWAWYGCGLSVHFFAGVILFSILFSVSITDLETGYIPDKFTLPGMAIGLLFSIFTPALFGQTNGLTALLRSLGGLLAGGGSLLALGIVGNFIFKKESMGGGDIKLLAMMGAFLGVKKAILILFFAPVVALPIALFLKFFKRAETIPFGPYLALTGAWFYLFGEEFVANLFYYYQG